MTAALIGSVISVGIDYTGSSHDLLPSALDDALRIERFFVESGYQSHPDCASLSCAAAREVADFLERWSDDRRSSAPGSKIVFYIAGHSRLHNGQHYILTPSSPTSPPYFGSKAIDTDDIVQSMINSGAKAGLVLLDTCYSGCAADEIQRSLDRAAAAQGVPTMDLAVLVPSLHYQRSYAGLFVAALMDALENGSRGQYWRDGDEFVTLYDLRNELRLRLEDDQCAYVAGRDGLRIVPNPRYRADAGDRAVEIGSLLVALPTADREHFLRTAAGVAAPGEAGWYFVGRETLSSRILDGVRQLDSGVIVVTGPPGAGKSALLGRLAVLADRASQPACRALGLFEAPSSTRPDVGAFDAVVYLKNKRLDEVVEGIAYQLDISVTRGANTVIELIDAVAAKPMPIRILVDGLDEAEPGDEALIARDVLRPLGSLPKCLIIVGTRRDRDGRASSVAGSEGPLIDSLRPRNAHFQLFDLDCDPTTAEDIATFIAGGLERGAPDKWPTPELRREAAERIADQSRRNFLFATFALRTLCTIEEHVVADSDWDLNLLSDVTDAGLYDVFAADMERFADPVMIRDLLTALAFSRGKGLPRRVVWAELATALAASSSGRAYGMADVARVIREAGWYLTESTEHGESVFRLYHQSVADYLRKAATRGQ